METWQQEVPDALNELQSNKGINLEKLQKNEEFFDILLQAISIGIRSHQDEKRLALKNAIIHSATDATIDFAIKQSFLNYIDTLTVWHINLLLLMDNPSGWFKEKNQATPTGGFGGIENVILVAYPNLREKKII